MTSRSERGREARGFTIIEVLVVLGLVGLLLAGTIGRQRGPSPRVATVGAARDIAGALPAARGEAIARNRPVAIVFDVVQRRWGRGGVGDQALPPGIALALLTQQAEAVAGSGRIRFWPDGSASGGRVIVEGGGHRLAVGVEWLTGRVVIAEAGR